MPVYLIAMPLVLFIGTLIGSYFPQKGWLALLFGIFILISYEVIVYFVYVRKAWRNIEKLKLGYDGEVYVGQQLDEMRVNGWTILHDFDTGRGNIDHIIIAPQGVFILETKTISQLGEDERTIYYDCEKVWTDKRQIASPLKQAKAEAKYLADYVNQKLTMNIYVRPIVTYSGWDYKYCGRQTLDECEVWVCQTKGLESVINSRLRILRQEEMKRVYNFLASENRV